MTLLQKIFIKDVMVKDVVSIRVDEPFSKVAEIFQEHGIRHLPVVDKGKKLLGIITQRDLYKLIPPMKKMGEDFLYDKEHLGDYLLKEISMGEGLFYDRTTLDRFILKNVMAKEPIALKAENTLGQAIDLMVKYKFGSIPIVDEGNNLVGILTHLDVLKALVKYLV